MPAANPKDETVVTPENNKKWKAYTLICIVSFVNFVSVSDVLGVEDAQQFFQLDENQAVAVMFGAVTFVVSLLILSHNTCDRRVLDLFETIRTKFDFKSLKNGKVEGFTLLAFVIWWTAGLIVTTHAGGIAYNTLNIYFSSWLSFFACIHALDRWGTEKEVMSLHELTRLSITLPAWWIVFFSSIVVFGSAADASAIVQIQSAKDSCSFAVAVGIVGALIAGFFVLSHYEFFQCCGACSTWLTYGGCFELSCVVVLIVWLLIGLDKLTGARCIGSTVTGNGLNPADENYVPGSNIYFSIWTTFISSVIVAVRWKEARAIKFAQTAEGQASAREEAGLGNEDGDSDGDI